MELELIRTYFPHGTNGELSYEGKRICFTIELPWLNTKHEVSCIPEGKYELEKRYSEHFGWHFQLKNVDQRSLILIHPANDAAKELKGCIAPVSILTAEGKGLQSKLALERLETIILPVFARANKVFLHIKSKINEHS